jgi:formiminotetrahydrofolate cyclodeaminase
VAEPDYLDLSLADFLDRTAAATAAPGAGAAAATTVALAAGLAAMSAGLSGRQIAEAGELASRAKVLQERVKPLGQRDAAAYGDVLRAQGRPKDDPERTAAVREALSRAADVPLEIAEIGIEVLDLAAGVVRRGNPNLRGDALTGCLLAHAGVRAAAVLVELNLDDVDDPRLARTGELVRAAQAAVPAAASSSQEK